MHRGSRCCNLNSMKLSLALLSVFSVGAMLAAWMFWISATRSKVMSRPLSWLPELLGEMDAYIWSAIEEDRRSGRGRRVWLSEGAGESMILSQEQEFCPKMPPSLQGKVEVSNIAPPSIDEISRKYRNFGDANYRPADCKARHRVAIVIPLRNRELHLRAFLDHMHPVWRRQQIDYTVYTITQAYRTLFNRGKLMNIGFTEARKDRKYDCYVFHDVDLLVENDKCLYWCPTTATNTTTGPRHLSSLIDKFGYQTHKYDLGICLPLKDQNIYVEVFGGVSVYTEEQFLAVNGFSNIYWGWGAEDDDLFLRTRKMGYTVEHEKKHCMYHMIYHKRERTNKANAMRFLLLRHSMARQAHDGLNSLKYKVLSREKTSIYTNIVVDVGTPSRRLAEAMGKLRADGSVDSYSCLQSLFWMHNKLAPKARRPK